ncbi:hypothetical protein D9619_002305 [Psilocybe cf. subviscida]|uniref:Uncharacterized protein n=1 Tax=Psilocybe cf. subviscida TaxID=2480587 RepID=A0A8H5AW84_9AGAR|nr:hypothetical protein D9619_002305 [Psilocybe cf. subviscida]
MTVDLVVQHIISPVWRARQMTRSGFWRTGGAPIVNRMEGLKQSKIRTGYGCCFRWGEWDTRTSPTLYPSHDAMFHLSLRRTWSSVKSATEEQVKALCEKIAGMRTEDGRKVDLVITEKGISGKTSSRSTTSPLCAASASQTITASRSPSALPSSTG